MKKYQRMIGDGKLPNKYWVFHYDEKFMQKDDELVSTNNKPDGGLIGEYSTYKEAVEAVNNKAYLPHVFIEDRLTGQVFETICTVCPCCNKEDWETIRDIQSTKNIMEKQGIKFA
jgi:hypothetical protein